jgi:hypothetical protein
MTTELLEVVKASPFANLKKSASARPIAAKKVADEEDKKDPEDEKDPKKDSKKKVEDEDESAKAEDEPKDDEKDSKKGKAKKAKADEDGDDDEPKKDDKKDARSDERARIKAIMAAGTANLEQAEYLAYETDMSSEQALGILKFSKAPEASTEIGLAAKMQTVPASTVITGDASDSLGLALSDNPVVRMVQTQNLRNHGKI